MTFAQLNTWNWATVNQTSSAQWHKLLNGEVGFEPRELGSIVGPHILRDSLLTFPKWKKNGTTEKNGYIVLLLIVSRVWPVDLQIINIYRFVLKEMATCNSL